MSANSAVAYLRSLRAASARASGVPHELQKRASSGFSWPQFGHTSICEPYANGPPTQAIWREFSPHGTNGEDGPDLGLKRPQTCVDSHPTGIRTNLSLLVVP